jgi:ubiquinone/menaquinone biosynthesis C-methylase UbiE
MKNQRFIQKIQELYKESVKKSENPAWLVKKKEHFYYDPRKNQEQLENLVNLIISSTQKRYFEKVLDIGSGKGDFAIAFSDFSKKVIGLEPDKFNLQIAKLNLKYFQKENIEFVSGFAENLPFENQSFDLVISTSTFEHLPNIEKSISEVWRVLKKDGYFFLNVPNYFWIRESHYELPMFPLMPKIFFKIIAKFSKRNPKYINHLNYLTPWFLEKILKKRGFKIENLTEKILSQKSSSKNLFKKIILSLMKKIKFYPHILILAKKT